MRCLVLDCGPSPDGNTAIAAGIVAEVLRGEGCDAALFRVHDLRLTPCSSCRVCERTGECPIDDDMRLLNPHVESDDLIVVAAPVFFYHLPGYAKIVVDRCQPFWARTRLLGGLPARPKRLQTVLIGGSRGERLFDGIRLTLRYWADAINAVTDESADLLLRGVDAPGDVRAYDVQVRAFARACCGRSVT
jgi:multimeric flavodoxin WrbA